MKRLMGMLSVISKGRMIRWYDRLTFSRILLIWISVIIAFGTIYFVLAGGSTFLWYIKNGSAVNKIYDTIYFSFVASATTGFGDIIPFGFFKVVAVIEVMLGLLLLAMVTSKLVSIKQDVILSEVYELSFFEKINRLRSSLLLFRQNLMRITSRVEEGTIRKRELSDLHHYISPFEDILVETNGLFGKSNTHFTKNVDPVNTELIYISVLNSFEKINELLTVLNQHAIEWRTQATLSSINRCISLSEELLLKLGSSKSLMKETVEDIRVRHRKALDLIRFNIDYPREIK